MNAYLSELIERIINKSDYGMENFNSGNSISFKALREAERIKEAAYVQQLMEYVKTEKNADKRQAAYFMLGKIGLNIQDERVTQFLIDCTCLEKSKNALWSLLGRIADLPKPPGTDIVPLINLVENKNSYVRSDAIMSLRYAKDDEAEKCLLRILETSTDEYDLHHTNVTLATMGSSKAIPCLLKLLDYSKMDVANTALMAIIEIGGQVYLPLFHQKLEKGKLKTTALTGVMKYGTEDSIPIVIKRIKELVSRQRKYEVIVRKEETELIVAMDFLLPYVKSRKEIRELYVWLVTKKNDLLFPLEKKWLENKAEYFS